MVDHQEDEGGSQTFLPQMLQSLEKGAEPSLVGLDDAVVLVVRALLDQPPSVVGEEAVVIVQVEPLRIPLGVI